MTMTYDDLEEALRHATTQDAIGHLLAAAHAAGMERDAWALLADWCDEQGGSVTEAPGYWLGVLYLDDGAVVLIEDGQGFRDARITDHAEADEALAEIHEAMAEDGED